MLKLYHWRTSTCSKRVRICLAAKQLEWTSALIALPKFENLDPDYLKLNPDGIVPTLIHDGRVLTESNVILEYLDDVFPDPALRPTEPYERALMRRWMDTFEHVTHRSVNVVSFIRQGRRDRYTKLSREEREALIARYPTETKRAELRSRIENGISDAQMRLAGDRLAAVLDNMETTLKDRQWLCGGAPTLADISISPFIERFEANRMAQLVDWSKRPSVGAWWQRMQAWDAFQKGFDYSAET